jgi:hypothetical protein
MTATLRPPVVPILHEFDDFLSRKLALLKESGRASDSVFFKAVEELHRILEERLPRASAGPPPRRADRLVEPLVRPRAVTPRPPLEFDPDPAGPDDDTLVLDYGHELLCLERAGELRREFLPRGLRRVKTSPPPDAGSPPAAPAETQPTEN